MVHINVEGLHKSSWKVQVLNRHFYFKEDHFQNIYVASGYSMIKGDYLVVIK